MCSCYLKLRLGFIACFWNGCHTRSWDSRSLDEESSCCRTTDIDVSWCITFAAKGLSMHSEALWPLQKQVRDDNCDSWSMIDLSANGQGSNCKRVHPVGLRFHYGKSTFAASQLWRRFHNCNGLAYIKDLKIGKTIFWQVGGEEPSICEFVLVDDCS